MQVTCLRSPGWLGGRSGWLLAVMSPLMSSPAPSQAQKCLVFSLPLLTLLHPRTHPLALNRSQDALCVPPASWLEPPWWPANSFWGLVSLVFGLKPPSLFSHLSFLTSEFLSKLLEQPISFFLILLPFLSTGIIGSGIKWNFIYESLTPPPFSSLSSETLEHSYYLVWKLANSSAYKDMYKSHSILNCLIVSVETF